MKSGIVFSLSIVAGLLLFSAPARASRPRKLSSMQREALANVLAKAKSRKTIVFLYIYDSNAPRSQRYLGDRKTCKEISTLRKIVEEKTLNLSNSKQHDLARDLGQVANRDALPIVIVLSPKGDILFWSNKYNDYQPSQFANILMRKIFRMADTRMRRREKEKRDEALMLYEVASKIAGDNPVIYETMENLYMATAIGYVRERDLGRSTRAALKLYSDKKNAEIASRVTGWWEQSKILEKDGKIKQRNKFLANIIRLAPKHPLSDKARKILDKEAVDYYDPLKVFKKDLERDQKRGNSTIASNPADDVNPTQPAVVDAFNGELPTKTPNAFSSSGTVAKNTESTQDLNERKAKAIMTGAMKLRDVSQALFARRIKKLIEDFPGTSSAEQAKKMAVQ